MLRPCKSKSKKSLKIRIKKLSRRIYQLIGSEKTKAWKEESSSKQQEEKKKLHEIPDIADPEAQQVNLVNDAAFVEPKKKVTKFSGEITNRIKRSKSWCSD